MLNDPNDLITMVNMEASTSLWRPAPSWFFFATSEQEVPVRGGSETRGRSVRSCKERTSDGVRRIRFFLSRLLSSLISASAVRPDRRGVPLVLLAGGAGQEVAGRLDYRSGLTRVQQDYSWFALRRGCRTTSPSSTEDRGRGGSLVTGSRKCQLFTSCSLVCRQCVSGSMFPCLKRVSERPSGASPRGRRRRSVRSG